MQAAVREPWVNRFDQVELDIQLKQLLAIFEKENALLKSLIARRSKTTSGAAAARRFRRWIISAFV
jgi:hypothetical protein